MFQNFKRNALTVQDIVKRSRSESKILQFFVPKKRNTRKTDGHKKKRVKDRKVSTIS